MDPINEFKPEFKSTQELYDAKHKKYRVWFILFITFLSLMFFVAIAAILHLVFKKDTYIEGYYKLIADGTEQQKQDFAFNLWRNSLIINAFYVAAILGFLIWFIINFAKCIKYKDYSKFSNIFIFLFPTIVFFNVIYLFFGTRIAYFRSWNVALLLTIINVVLIVLTQIIAFTKVRNTVYEFYRLKVALKSPAEQFSDMVNSVNSPRADETSAFGYKYDEAAKENLVNEKNSNNKQLDTAYYQDMLDKLDHGKLIDMANKLNIYEPESLSRSALTAKIIDIFTSKNNSNSNDKKPSDDDKPIQ